MTHLALASRKWLTHGEYTNASPKCEDKLTAAAEHGSDSRISNRLCSQGQPLGGGEVVLDF